MYCNGAFAVFVSGRQCTVPLADLTTTPFNLVLGDHVDVKVIAKNIYGSSDFSAVGDGATIKLVPDAPLNLQNLPDITTATRIGLSWTPGVSDGGSPVLDYQIFYGLDTG